MVRNLKQDLIDVLTNLIGFDTSAGNKKQQIAILDYIEKRFIKYSNISITRYSENNNMVICNNKQNFPRIFLVGHLDVVPATYRNAFIAKINKNKLCGRGASDMKGPVASLIVALEYILQNNMDKNICLLLTMDEEIGGEHGVKDLLFNQGLNGDIAFLPDGGDNWNLIHKEKGVLRIRVKSRGISAHGAYLWEGKNAIENLIAFYNEFKKQFIIEFGDIVLDRNKWRPSLNLGMLNGGLAPNQVPDSAEAVLDIRYTDLKERRKILIILNKLEKEFVDIEYMIFEDTHPNVMDIDNVYIRKWIDTAKKHGKELVIRNTHGASDNRYFAEKHIPVIMSKPIASKQHIDNEWIDLNSLVEFTEILIDWITSLY